MGKSEASAFVAFDRSLRAEEPAPGPGRLRTVVICTLMLAAIVGGFRIIVLLIGRFEVRNDPLDNPIAVTEIGDDGSLLLEDGTRCRLAGVEWAAKPLDPAARGFLRTVTRQGVEVVRRLDDGRYILLCEPRVAHWCGNDRVSAHYERFCLNELVLTFGCARHSAHEGLTKTEAYRMRECAEFARSHEWGIWADPGGEKELANMFEPESGLSIREVWGSHFDDVERWNRIVRRP